ncbi:18825_t:CDS:1, partial [Acaulospora morrowiae]
MFNRKTLQASALIRLSSSIKAKLQNRGSSVIPPLSHCSRSFVSQHSTKLNYASFINHNSLSSALESLYPLIKHNHFSRAYTTGLQGQFKTYKPRTPGLRWLKRPINDHLWKGKPVRKLTVAKRATGGRNHHGHITVRHRGGGHKRRIRL